jgi:hypothetical protein
MGLGQMSKLEIKYVSLEAVRPYAGNARTHSKKADPPDCGFDRALWLREPDHRIQRS